MKTININTLTDQFYSKYWETNTLKTNKIEGLASIFPHKFCSQYRLGSGLFSSENYSIHITTFQDLEETEYAKYSIQNLKHFKQATNPWDFFLLVWY